MPSANPYETPRHDSDEPAELGRQQNLLVSMVAVAGVLSYSLLAVALIFGDSTADTLMGGLMACNWPLMGLWLWKTLGADDRALLFGWLAISVQLGIALLMIYLLGVPFNQILIVNGVTIAVILSLNMVMLWLRKL